MVMRLWKKESSPPCLLIFLWLRYFSALQYIHNITFDALQLIDGKRSAKTQGDVSKILVCPEQYVYSKNRDNRDSQRDGDLVTVGILIFFPVNQMPHRSVGDAVLILTVALQRRPLQGAGTWRLVRQGYPAPQSMRTISPTLAR